MPKGKKTPKSEKKVTRYSYSEIKEPRTPETGHTSLIADEQVVTLPMDNGWSKALEVTKLPDGDNRVVVIDMDPAADPVLFWAGKRNRREVPILPLQRNEIVTESRIAQIVDRARRAAEEESGAKQQGHLFADLEKELRDGDKSKRVEFYTHDESWKNKLICGDSLHVMESLLHYENLRGNVQMIYIDPPYGVKYDSNFQQRVDSTKNDDKDQADDVLTIKAFRDTWSLGIHSYLSYLQHRLYLARDLLRASGSVFVQISEENQNLVRTLMDEVFGRAQHAGTIAFRRTGALTDSRLPVVTDYLVWYARDSTQMKYRPILVDRRETPDGLTAFRYAWRADGTVRSLAELGVDESSLPKGWHLCQSVTLTSQHPSPTRSVPFQFNGQLYRPPSNRQWSVDVPDGLNRVADANRIFVAGDNLRFAALLDDNPMTALTNVWMDTGVGSFTDENHYVVQTPPKVLERCIFMTTDPGDLVFDPTCGGGTTPTSAEKLGRRWIACDTSRVAINVARKRVASSVFPHFKTRNGSLSGGFEYKTFGKVSVSSLAYQLEPEQVEVTSKPDIDLEAIRVCGPFEVMSLGRYSLEDWKGYVVSESGIDEPAKLENYIEVIGRLYRKDAAIQGAIGLVHAVAESEKEKIAISVGPLSGRVTGKQINDAVQDALSCGILEVHVLGWAFEANVGEVKSQLEKRGKVKVELIMIRPDTLAEGLKATQPEMLFSPLALPDIEIEEVDDQMVVRLNGVALFDRKRSTTEYKAADSGYVSAWYLDEDYDGDCFVDCQMFFDFKRKPNLKAALKAEIDSDEYELKLISEPFKTGQYNRIAIKVVDVYGNESTMVREISGA